MGIYLYNMEMPKERESFTLTIKYNGLVFDTDTGIQVAEAQEVPPHGRLIDADHVMHNMRSEHPYVQNAIRATIRAAPTIIPAEEEI